MKVPMVPRGSSLSLKLKIDLELNGCGVTFTESLSLRTLAAIIRAALADGTPRVRVLWLSGAC